MQTQGQQRVKDHTDVLNRIKRGADSPLELVNLSPAQLMAAGRAYLPIGVYKGGVAFLDLDKMVNLPLVAVEQMHILGVLDGRLEDFDLQTITLPAGSAIGASVRQRLTIPAGETWYINDVQTVTPADSGGRASINWRCSLWPEGGTNPDADGQAFHAVAQADALGLGAVFDDEFHPGAPFIAPENKSVLLRLPGGAVITFQAVNTIAAAVADMMCTGALYGFRTTQLVQ